MKDSILAEPMALNNMIALRTMLAMNKIEIVAGNKLTDIKENKAILANSNGEIKEVKCDSLVLALGFKSVQDLKEKVSLQIKDIRVIGDAESPRRIKHAIAEGFQVGIEI